VPRDPLTVDDATNRWAANESNMDRKKPTWDSPNLYCWIAIILVACLVYAIGITHESIWFDEAYSAVMAGHSFSQIISLTAIDKHPPLYFLLLRVVSTVLGTSDWALRTLSVAGAVALVSLGAGPVRRIFGNKTAYIYVALTIFTPGILIYAHEARMYTLAIFTVTASALYGYLAAQHNQTMDWGWFGITSLAAAYLHNYALMAVFYLYIFIFLWLLIKKRAHLKSYFFAGGIVLAGYLPWAFVLLNQIQSTKQASVIPPLSPRWIMASFHTPFAYKYLYPAVTLIMSAVVLFSIGLIISGLIVAKYKKLENELTFGMFLLLASLFTIQTPILISRIFTPVFYYRYTIVYTGLLLLLLSVSISVLPRQVLQCIAVGVFAILNIFALKDIYREQFNEPGKDVYQSLQGEVQPGDLIITTDAYTMGPMLYYFPNAEHYFYINDTEAQWEQMFTPFADRLHNEDELDELLATRQSFWYITSNAGLSKPSWVFLQDKDGWEESFQPRTYSKPFAFRSFTVEKFIYIGRENNLQQEY
jgi:uncharacterized membrane protein